MLADNLVFNKAEFYGVYFCGAERSRRLHRRRRRGKPDALTPTTRRGNMTNPPPRSRRPTSAIERAEAVFRPAAPEPAAAPAKAASVPTGKETVSLRLDRDVLAFFQDDGPGWQDRINAALRRAAGI